MSDFTKADLIDFLKENGAYISFKEAVKNNITGDPTDPDEVMDYYEKEDRLVEVINDSFLWTDTEDGFEFWNDLDTLLHKKIYEDY